MTAESHIDFYQRWHWLSCPYFRRPFKQFQPFVGGRVAGMGCGRGNFTELLGPLVFKGPPAQAKTACQR